MISEQIENFIDKNSRTVKETTKNKVVKIYEVCCSYLESWTL